MPCTYCGSLLSILPGSPARWSRDHVIPRSRSREVGRVTVKYQGRLHQTVPACSPCNQDKAALLPSEWLYVLAWTGDPRFEHVRRVFQQMGVLPGGND